MRNLCKLDKENKRMTHEKMIEKKENKKVWFNLVWFYGISTIIDYLMPNTFLYIKQFYFDQFRLA